MKKRIKFINAIRGIHLNSIFHMAFCSVSVLGLCSAAAQDQAVDVKGELRLTELMTGVTPEPKQVYLGSDGQNPFLINSDTIIFIDRNAEALVERGAMLLQEDMEVLYGLRVPVERMTLPDAGAGLLIGSRLASAERAWSDLHEVIKSLPDEGGSESYRLAILPAGVAISSSAPAGTFYGVQTVRQLLRGDGSVPSLAIADWPDQAIRASYGNPPGGDIEAYVQKLARLKMNMAIVESSWNSARNWWYNPTGQNLEQAKLFFKLCREYNIEPVPLVQGFGWSYGVVGINPHCAEGVWVKDERHTLRGVESAVINNPNVIRTEAAPIIVTDSSGNVRYEEGKDYEILPGLTQARFAVDNKPWEIVRIEGGRIRDGQEIRLDYNYMTFCEAQTPHCPSEPETYKIIDQTLENVIRIFEPKYIHIGHDEVRYINRCRRCQQSGLTPAELVSKEIRHWYDTINRLDSSIDVMMWADLLRRDRFGEFILPLLPEDLIICPWAYRADEVTLGYMAEQMDYFAVEKGRRTLGACSGYTHRNIWAWKEVLEVLAPNDNCLGFIFTYWGDGVRFWSALSFAAEYMWSRNKVGEELFELYESADLLSRNRGVGLTLDLNAQRADLAKYADLLLMRGENVREDGERLSAQLDELAVKIKAHMIPDLASFEVATGTVPERILTQISIIPGYYTAMGKYLDAQREYLQGHVATATMLISELSQEFRQQRYPGYAAAEAWGVQYEETGRFPSSLEVFGVQMKRPLLFDVSGTSLQLASLGDLLVEQGDGFLIYDLQVYRDVHGLQFKPVGEGAYSISLSVDGKHFEAVADDELASIVDEKAGTTLVWPAERVRWVRVQWDDKVSGAPEALEISVVKEEADYLCQWKPGGNAWSKPAFWEDVPLAAGFVTRENNTIKVSRWETLAQAVYDDEYLYVRFECPMSDPAKLVVNAEYEKESATQIWENDCVQLFIRTRESAMGEVADFYQVIVNSAGDYMLRRFNRTDKSVEIKTHTEVMDDKWVCYMAIPLEWLDVEGDLDGQEWGVNFCRTKHDPYEHSSWALLPQGLMSWFLQPDYFGTLRFESESASTQNASSE